jgi:diguanylate cyclase (GGDEF)-like protein
MVRDGADPDVTTFVRSSVNVADAALQRDRACLIVISGPNVGEFFPIRGGAVLGRALDVDVRLVDAGISRRHAEIVVDGDEIWLEDLGSKNGSFVNGVQVRRHRLRAGDKIQLGASTLLRFELQDQLDENFQRQMYESALRDSLTGIYNRRYFVDRVRSEMAYALRHRTPLALLLFDVDHFKQVNDAFGHLAGDAVLAAVARHVQRIIRSEDVFARFGGEEFAVLSRGIAAAGALRLADRLRAAIETHTFCYEGRQIPVTISIGVAWVPAPGVASAEDVIACADRALYEAKRAGRNRVCVSA